MTDFIETLDQLHGHYGTPGPAATEKVAGRLTAEYRRWIMASRFAVLTTVGPEGTDASPRGDDGPVVTVLDDQTLVLPDWRGNDRIDSLRNIVRDGRASLMFLVPGSKNVIRVNGTAKLTADADLRQSFARGTALPRTVIVFRIAEIYSQCGRAILRARLWTSGDESADLPTVGQMLDSLTNGRIDGRIYDAEWADRAAGTMW